MTSAQGSPYWSYYTYDGNGYRVRRSVNNQETWQVYGLGGELLAEYAANASATTPQKEYGYRNGQLLITATVTAGGWGAPPVFDDNPLNPHYFGETTVRAAHITQLRDSINALRGHLGYAPYAWQYSATTIDLISANPIIEMRIALDQALGAPSGGYAPGLAQYQPVMAIHIQELRNRVLAAWGSGSSTQVNWLVADQLGTPRMIFDQSGSLANVSRHDYLPFGEELFAGTGGRTIAQGYSASDGVRFQFTDKERDNETGLDYFGSRYFASTQGRFTSPDPFSIIQMRQSAPNDEKTHSAFMQFIGDPRRWNRFAYAVNSPLVFTDKTGLDIMIIENGPTRPGNGNGLGNPLGHTAIAITGRGVFSMGNGQSETQRDNKHNILGGSVRDYLDRESSRRNTTIIIIKTTPEQDAAIEASLRQQAANKPMLKSDTAIGADNCSTRVNEALDAAGIARAGDPAFPGSAGLRARVDGGLGEVPTVIEIPKDQQQYQMTDLQAIQQFEPRRNSSIPSPGAPGGTPVMTMPMKKKPEDE